MYVYTYGSFYSNRFLYDFFDKPLALFIPPHVFPPLFYPCTPHSNLVLPILLFFLIVLEVLHREVWHKRNFYRFNTEAILCFTCLLWKFWNIGWYKQEIIITHSQLTQCLNLSSFDFFLPPSLLFFFCSFSSFPLVFPKVFSIRIFEKIFY